MGEYYKYDDALASTTKIEDITSDDNNAAILQRLKDNDEETVFLSNVWEGEDDFVPGCTGDFGWFGYFIGKNTSLETLGFYNTENFAGKFSEIKLFCRGICRNDSIKKVNFYGNLAGGEIFTSQLNTFFQSHDKLVEIKLEGCTLGSGCAQNLSVLLGGCQNKSLKRFVFKDNELGDEHITDIIVALSMHPQLEEVHLVRSDIERDQCHALSTLLSWSTTAMRKLELRSSTIDCEGMKIMAHALENHRALYSLDLSGNPIGDAGMDALRYALTTSSDNTIRIMNLSGNSALTLNGFRSLADLLRSDNCQLEELYLCNCHADDDAAPIFAKALEKNYKLKTLGLDGNIITSEGWASFAKVLCDTSTVNKTFLSNHCLKQLANCATLPVDVRSFLTLNRSFQENRQVAMNKILQHHSSFMVEPLFEWDFKMLPHAISWFDNAASLTLASQQSATLGLGGKVRRWKLSSIYGFLRGLPQLYIKICTRKQLDEILGEKMKLQWEQLQLTARLEEVEQREARAMGRL